MEIKKIDYTQPQSNAVCKVKTTGNITEIMHSEKQSQGSHITKLSKDFYINNDTGEVKEFKHTENRSQSLVEVSRSLAFGRDLINTNCSIADNIKWCTLTYAENMRDDKQVYCDWKRTAQHLRRKYGHFEYIICIEPQQRGAWHIHAILIFESKAPFIPVDDFARIWGKGFCKLNAVTDCDNIGAYLSAYLGDIELTDFKGDVSHYQVKECQFVDRDGKKQSKKFVKGARLFLYPAQMHIFRWSRGVKKPTVEHMSYEQAKEKVSGATLTYQKSIVLNDVETDFCNTLSYEYYNALRV